MYKSYRQPDMQAFPPVIYMTGVHLPGKGMARIYVKEEKHIPIVEGILHDLDDYEFENYYPKGLVTTYKGVTENLVYVGKYDLDIVQLLTVTQSVGIPCYVIVELPGID